MDPNTAALSPTQTTIVVVAVLVLSAIALWVLVSWRPRHRARQAETAAQMFREDHLGEWARKRLSTWTTDERHAALRYYTRVGFQARSGAIRTDMVPNNHHATIVALAAQETDGGTSQTKWGEVEWLGRNLAKRRDDLSIKWTPTAKANPDPEAPDKAPTAADVTAAHKGSVASATETETAAEPAQDVTGGVESDSLNLAAAMDQANSAHDLATERVSTLGKSAIEVAVNDIEEDSFDDTNDADEEVPDGTSEPTTGVELDAAAIDAAGGALKADVTTTNDDEEDPESDTGDVSGQVGDESTSDSTDAEDVDGAVAAETVVDPSATTARADTLADVLARAEVAPDIAAASKSFAIPSSSDDPKNEVLVETMGSDAASVTTAEADSSPDSTLARRDTSETQVSDAPNPEIEATISESTPSEGTTNRSSDDDQATDRANVPTWILDARAALDSLDTNATSVSAEDEAVSPNASETVDNHIPSDTLATANDLDADDVALADLDDVEVAYLAASTATAATEADIELRVRMQRLRRRAKRQMRKSADDRAVAVRRAEQGRKKKAREYTKRAAAHETKAKKFKARRRKLREIRQGTYKG